MAEVAPGAEAEARAGRCGQAAGAEPAAAAAAWRPAVPSPRGSAAAAGAGPSGRPPEEAARSPPDDPDRAGRRIRAAKRAGRSELSVSGGGWTVQGYAADPSLLATAQLPPDDVPRIHASQLTREDYVRRFEAPPGRPLVITGLMDDWPAMRPAGQPGSWALEALAASHGDTKLKCGSDDDGYPVRLRLQYYLQYLRGEALVDDSPLYVFDGSVLDKSDGEKGAGSLRGGYSVPAFFSEDLFSLAGERRRPPYRWIVLGPARSGSSMHIDPLATSAWNALVFGAKRWALLPGPPAVPRAAVRPPGEPGLDAGEAAGWFARIWPRTQAPDWAGPRPLSLVQRPGEIVFVPAGWWHAVLNLEPSLAVTQNFASTATFPRVWRQTARSRPRLAARWLAALRAARPDLAAVADAQPRRGEGSSQSGSSSSSDSDSSSSSSSSSSEEESAHDGEGDREGGDGAGEGAGGGGERPEGGRSRSRRHRTPPPREAPEDAAREGPAEAGSPEAKRARRHEAADDVHAGDDRELER